MHPARDAPDAECTRRGPGRGPAGYGAGVHRTMVLAPNIRPGAALLWL